MRRGTDRHTDTQMRVINIHFASSATHTKCNNTHNNWIYWITMDRLGQLSKTRSAYRTHAESLGRTNCSTPQKLILSRVPSDLDKARLLAAASPHSGDWLQAPPITAVGLRLSDEAARVAVTHRLGCKAHDVRTWKASDSNICRVEPDV